MKDAVSAPHPSPPAMVPAMPQYSPRQHLPSSAPMITPGKIVVCGFALALALFFALIFCPPNFALSDEHDFDFALCCAL